MGEKLTEKRTVHPDETPPILTDRETEIASVLLAPSNTTAPILELLSRGEWGPQSMVAFSDVLWNEARTAGDGDLKTQREMLVSQSFALHGLFTELTRRAALNLGESLGAVETYMRLALKAQAQSRATIEALERLVNGREQTVRHVHVNPGGQAIVADQFHHHTGGAENEKSLDQPHAQGARRSALPGPDTLGNVVPVSGDKGKAPVPNARGEGKRRAQRQS